VRTRARVLRLVPGRTAQVRAVEWLDADGKTRHLTQARQFILAANAVQTARLLLNSSAKWAPDGIGNSSGLVGAGLSVKLSGYVSGVRAVSKVAPPGGPHSTVAFSDYYLHPDIPGQLGGIMYQANPVVGDDGRTVRVHVLAGDQPVERNRVRLARQRDTWGIPKAVLDYRIHPRDGDRLRFLAQQATNLLHAAKVSRIRFEATEFHRGSRHLHGTCRSGSDPKESVTTPDGRLHDLDNVHVVDASLFPFAGGVNPVLTIQANALRIARNLTAQPTGPRYVD